MEREAAKGKITEEEVVASLKRIEGTLQRRNLAECDFVIEARRERFDTQDRSYFASWMTCCPKR